MSIECDLVELSRGQLDTFLTTDWLSYYENSDNWANDGIQMVLTGYKISSNVI